MFTSIPGVVYKLESLEKLDIARNTQLETLHDEILQMEKLKVLHCWGNYSIKYPPYAVCEQGLSAVKAFITDLRADRGTEVTVVPVAIVGNQMSGKTSLVRSLQEGNRRLTFRKEHDPLDETTRVFDVHNLEIGNFMVKMIDYAGSSVYRLTYSFTKKENFIPLLVVNLQEFVHLSSMLDPIEATKAVCFDWISYLYLPSPGLGSPILVLTHTDKLASGQVTQHKSKLLESCEEIRHGLLFEERQCSGLVYNLSHIAHLSNTENPLFAAGEIFEFNDDVTETTNIDLLKKTLGDRCSKFNAIIPRLWETVGAFIDEQEREPYVRLSDIASKYPSDDFLVILRYMHNMGKVLWFEHVEKLSNHIFHQIPTIVQMITLIFHHSSEEQWKQKLDHFVPFTHNGQVILKNKYQWLIEQFFQTGVLDGAVLMNLLATESAIPAEIAIELLRCFHILHGPVSRPNGEAYIIPYFATAAVDQSWQTQSDLQLRIDVVFGGLTLPKDVYHLMTVAVLNYTFDFASDVEVRKNGATVYHDEGSTHIVHSYNSKKITLQVSTSVQLLESSWRHLVETRQCILDLLSHSWKAYCAETLVYCSHCLFLRDPSPDYDPDPCWLISPDATRQTEAWLGCCRRHSTLREEKRPTVPKYLRSE